MLVASKPFLRISGPTDVTVIWSMETTIGNTYRTTLLTEDNLFVMAFHIEITIDKERTMSVCTPKRLLSI
jgi:hypothetical protein